MVKAVKCKGGTGEFWYLVSLVLAVLFADAAHERPGLAAVLQTHELDGVDLVLRTQGLLVRFVGQRDAAVFGQRAGGVRELRTLCAEVRCAHRAVHRRRVALVLVAPYDALQDRMFSFNILKAEIQSGTFMHVSSTGTRAELSGEKQRLLLASVESDCTSTFICKSAHLHANNLRCCY